jgi:hypothetical protein
MTRWASMTEQQMDRHQTGIGAGDRTGRSTRRSAGEYRAQYRSEAGSEAGACTWRGARPEPGEALTSSETS